MVNDLAMRATTGPRTVLVTGGASGIGRAVVDEFAARGDTVVVLDNREPSDELARIATVMVGDVTSAADNDRAVATALSLTGRLDVFVGNAGVHDGGVGVTDLDADALAGVVRRVFEVDVIGYLLGARSSAAALKASHGCMIFTLSDASYMVHGNNAGIGYVIAKHGALGMVRHLAADLAPDIRVNAVAPGGIITQLQSVIPGDGTRPSFADPAQAQRQTVALNPLSVMLTPAEIAPLYSFLASPAARGMTAEVLRTDGGLSVR